MGKAILNRIQWVLLAAAVIAGAVVLDTRLQRSSSREVPEAEPSAEPREAPPIRINEISASNE
ncbi:MAG: hypothetical protein J6P58_02285, partial [Oscillospiraceae bacterium]|nr:hypothetical protein [Oscillospiraceae bacterium]